MRFTPGTRFAFYEITAPLGRGGMGEVYRATDTKLRRQVALKFLPAAVASDRERMARFEREAQLLAALNHPNIAGIYGLESFEGVPALVMELVEGDTLGERILRGPLSLDEALPLAKQLAEALEYAHERGIIHRDLKPANLKVREDGTLKVLDFGIAKALGDDLPAADIHSSPTVTVEVTRAGVILGTAAYMSPEQARGKAVDRRADIWSFGCVLFEMLTGKIAFAGDSVADTVSAILTREPEWDQLPSTTPRRMRELLRRCLQKDLRKRLQSVGDARIEIEECRAVSDTGELQGPAAGAPSRRTSRAMAAALAAAVVLVVLAGIAGWWLKGRGSTAPLWSGTMLPGSSVAFGPRVSPDGHMVAFQAMVNNLTQVAVVNIDSGNWTLLTHDRDHGFVNEISWAPDGSRVYFDRVVALPRGIYSVPALGGAERLVLENAGTPEVLPDDSLIVVRNDAGQRLRIFHYWPDSQRLDPLPGWITLNSTIPLRVFGDGKELVFLGTVTESDSNDHLYAMDIATGRSRRLAADLQIVPSGESFPLAPTSDGQAVVIDIPGGDLHRIVAVPRFAGGPITTLLTLTRGPWYMDFGKDGTLYTDELDRPHEVLRFPSGGGAPEVLAHSESRVASGYTDAIQTSDGRILYDARFSGRAQLLLGKSGGDFFPLLETREETSLPAAYLPNDEVALVLGSGENRTIAIASAGQGRLIRRLQGTKGRPIEALACSPDGKTLYYSSGGAIWAIPADDGTPRQVAKGNSVATTPDGQELIVKVDQGTGGTLFRVPLSGGTPQEIRLPDGLWIAPVALGQSAVAKDKKILISVSPQDSWFYRLVVFDLATGRVTKVPVTYTGDTIIGDWMSDGRVLAVGLPLKSHVRRFTRAGEAH